VVVSSRSVAERYVPAPSDGVDRADTRIESGRFLTADLGYLDAQQRLHLVGRAAEVVNVGGRKVFPAEVERVIRAVPGVRDVVVVGIERSPTAHALYAIVAGNPAVERRAVLDACRASLAPYKVPRAIELVDEIPRTARGKIDRAALRSIAERRGLARADQGR